MVRKIGVERSINIERLEEKAKTLEVQSRGGEFIVKSGTTKGSWYRVTPEKCECLGFKFNKICSHVVAVRIFKGRVEGKDEVPLE